MKKFKLIKQYPGSPNLGTICEERNIKSSFCYYFEGEKNIGITKDQVENQPEYWEEVVEKNYEILISRVVPQEILSVKRLSDGEVFTVGDLVKTPYTDCTRITGFENPEGREYFIEISTEYCTGISTGFTRLLSLEKIKQPIFLTHNGKDIFEGDKVWYVNKENFYYDYILAFPEVKFNSEMRAYFLTRIEAEDYIERNKPLFTTEDGVGIFRGDICWLVDTDFSISMMEALHGCGQCTERRYFSTFELAEDYVIRNAKLISIEDFNNAIASQHGNYNIRQKLIQIAKQRLIKK